MQPITALFEQLAHKRGFRGGARGPGQIVSDFPMLASSPCVHTWMEWESEGNNTCNSVAKSHTNSSTALWRPYFWNRLHTRYYSDKSKKIRTASNMTNLFLEERFKKAMLCKDTCQHYMGNVKWKPNTCHKTHSSQKSWGPPLWSKW